MSDSSIYQIACTREQFSKLLTMLQIFQNHCNDCDIKKGIFRCRTNDRQAVLEMNLSSILQENDLALGIVKEKVALLKSFELDDNVQMDDKNLYISGTESNFEFRDQISKTTFRKPIPKYLDNKFIDAEEFSNMIKCREENLIMSYVFSSYLKKRIANICMGFKTEVLECIANGTESNIRINSSNKQDSATVGNAIPLNKEVNNKKFNVLILPFMLDVISDIRFSCYSVSNDVCLCKSELVYFGIPVSIYTQAKLTNIEE